MTIVDSLKNLLKKFGGDPSALEENATSSDVINAITNAYTDKEGTYTEVTPIGDSGDKIATITTNNTAHDIYAPKELPAVTSEDEGNVLGVNSSGEWTKMNVPNELPSVTSSDNGKVLSVSNGNWNKNTLPKVNVIPCTIIAGANMIQINRYTIGNIKDIVTSTSVFDAVMLRNLSSPYEYFICTGYEDDGTNTYISFMRITRGANSTKYEKALFNISDTTSFQGTYSATTVNDPT